MRRKYIIAGMLLLFFIASLLFLRFGGEVLVVEDDYTDVDEAALVLLMGSVGDRAFGAYELYEDGKISEIIIVRSYLAGREQLEEKGIHVPEDAERSKYVLTELGVPAEAIIIVPGDAASTMEEALAVKDYLTDRPDIENLVLTTSKYHSYRSKAIFNKALEDFEVKVYSSPTPYDEFEARGWYRDREDIQRVVTEYIKLINHFFLEQFQMD